LIKDEKLGWNYRVKKGTLRYSTHLAVRIFQSNLLAHMEQNHRLEYWHVQKNPEIDHLETLYKPAAA
jgi:hypothetical protein